MNKSLFITLFLLIGQYLPAANYYCYTEAGGLQTHLDGKSGTITDLTLSGTIDARDFTFINDSLSHLTSLDLTNCSINAFESREVYVGGQTQYEANSIPTNSFFGFQQLTTIRLPRNTEKIGSGAFAGCSNLTMVEWGSALRVINDFAFCDCSSLNTPLPKTLTQIGEYSFKQCDSYTQIDLSSSALTSIGERAFLNCKALASISLPASLRSLGDQCFSGCAALSSISLPQNLRDIGEGCFSYCTALTSVDIKSCPWETLPPYLFDHCTSLISVQVPQSITKVGEGAFYYCTSLINCTLPESVQSIGDYAFAGCNRIEHMRFLPEGLENIGRWPFYGMKGLYSAQIPSTVTYIGDHAFDNCTRLTILIAYPETPPLLGEAVFQEVAQEICSLAVPDESASLYRNAPQWKEFKLQNLSDKEEIEPEHDELNAHFEGKTLIVRSGIPMLRIALYTIDGRMVHQTQIETTESTIDTQAYPGRIFILSVQMQSGEYRHLKLGRID